MAEVGRRRGVGSGTGLTWLKVSVLPVIVATWGFFALAGAGSASASPAAPQVAVVLTAGATPASLSSGGGDVAVAATVENATECQLQLISSQSFPVIFSRNPRNCSDGVFSAQVTIGPNNSAVQRTIAFNLVARNAKSSSAGRFYVLLAGAKPSSVVSVRVTPAKLEAGGGIVTIAATVQDASACQLQLLSAQSFAVVYSHNPKTCVDGSFSAKVTVGANPTTVPRTVAFSLLASNLASHAGDPFYISLGAAASATPAPVTPKSTVPATAGQPSVAASSAPPSVTQSSNWSGYSTAGGPFTVVKGTFTVPNVMEGTPAYDQVAEWVGVDGVSSSDTSLIQAGVDEYTDPLNPNGFDVQPWWEILPAAETNITSVAVKAGDSVSVTVWEVSTGSWEMNLTDNNNGQSYTTPPEHYAGPAESAEWVVEATTRCTFRCETSGLAPYTPAVTFSGLGMTGRETSLEEDTMVQQGMNVATPTALTSSGFSVAYTGQQLFGRPEAKAG